MANREPFLGKKTSITIDGDTFTTEITNFTEDGGTENREYTKTMGRRQRKKTVSGKEDYTVTFDFTVFDSGFQNILEEGDVVNKVELTETDSTGSTFTITYNNSRVESLNYEHSPEDRLVGNIEFNVPAYDSSGSRNRSIS